MILLSLVLTLIGMLLLYKCSAKQITKAKQQVFIRYKTQLRVLAYACFLIAGSLLCLTYGSSIGFISWWIFATPVTFVLVLSVNELKPTKKLK
ncbi:DUF1634 domain-containing protein [Acinetobacter courvalinii]|jgi:fatty acid desaturase|uniref:DUF1634 domain-containing protein n=1 Tax=Acinetobacter courvalinii TaxID=280147 RepID=UPI0018FFA4D2|nr:DUF1634 domain-containing protein [Acinetobacter courvalinii]MBJ9955551.1 DUF1634 domain-containing protein [Acinetobacter courvalinii]